MTSDRCVDDRCAYPEPHRHGFACSECEQCERARVKVCQHCYRMVMMMPSDDPGGADVARDGTGSRECMPGVFHKRMPEVK